MEQPNIELIENVDDKILEIPQTKVESMFYNYFPSLNYSSESLYFTTFIIIICIILYYNSR